jgi:hypothetical protein
VILSKDYTRIAARAIPFITKEDLRLTRDGDPFVDPDWLESGLKRLMTYQDEHYTYTGKKRRHEKWGTVFLYVSGQQEIWVGKDHKVHKES